MNKGTNFILWWNRIVPKNQSPKRYRQYITKGFDLINAVLLIRLRLYRTNQLANIMKMNFTKVSNYIIGILLTAIGFPSCSKDNKENQLYMYGTPIAEYQISGKVTDNDSDPIAGISVSVFSREILEVITDKDGNYKLDATTSGFGNLELSIEDIDGVKNGEFETKKKVETFNKSDFKGEDGAWNLGKAARTVNIMLTEKTTPEK